MSWLRCASSTYDCSRVSCAMPARRTPWFANTCMSYFRCWPTLRWCGLSSHGFSASSVSCERQLIRRSRVAVRQRDVAGLERLDRQRQADQSRRERIERGRLGVDAREFGRADPAQPVLQLLARQHRLVLHVGPRGGRGRRLGSDRCVAARRRRLADVLQPALELVAREELAQPLAVLAAVGERVHRLDVPAEVAVGLHGDERPGRRQPRQRLAQVLAHRAADLARVLDDRVERAVLADPLARRSSARPSRRPARCRRRRRRASGSRRCAPAARRTSASRRRRRASRCSSC